MRSGVKNCLVYIYRVTEIKDPDTNASLPSDALWKTVWANATARRGRETEIEGAIRSESYMRFDFDYLDIVGITELDFIVYEDVEYGITGLLPDIATKDFFVVDTIARGARPLRA